MLIPRAGFDAGRCSKPNSVRPRFRVGLFSGIDSVSVVGPFRRVLPPANYVDPRFVFRDLKERIEPRRGLRPILGGGTERSSADDVNLVVFVDRKSTRLNS